MGPNFPLPHLVKHRFIQKFRAFSRNMVIALKELSIRGDFRTTVEYLIKLLETEHFQNNTIHTGWLDKLIVEKVQVRDKARQAHCGEGPGKTDREFPGPCEAVRVVVKMNLP